MSTETLHDTTGPSIALSEDDRELAEDLVECIESLDFLEEEELRDQYFEEHGEFRDHGGVTLDDYKEGHKPAKLGLPSFGSEREDCGVGIPHVCEGCGNPVEIGRTCSQSRCPRCWSSWVMERAPGIVARIQSAAKMKEGAVYKHHGVISPPPETYIDAEHPEQAALDAVGDMMERIDFDGIALYHPWSGKNDEDRFDDEHDDDQGEWKKRIGSERDWFGDVREDLQHRPHIHVIGATSWFPGGDVTDYIHDQTGWVIHRITERNGSAISLSDPESIARAVCYALSHTAIDTREDGFGGEYDTFVRKKKGSAYHAPNDSDPHPSHEQNLREAEEAVAKVAPDVLGVPSANIECKVSVEDVEDEHKDHHAEDHLDAEGDGESTPSSDDSSSTKVRKCRGDLVDVDDADFVEDEKWQRRAEHADEAVQVREEWKKSGGWEAWTDRSVQATLEGKPVVDPPD